MQGSRVTEKHVDPKAAKGIVKEKFRYALDANQFANQSRMHGQQDSVAGNTDSIMLKGKLIKSNGKSIRQTVNDYSGQYGQAVLGIPVFSEPSEMEDEIVE